MADILPFEPVIKEGTLSRLFQHILLLARRKHLTVSWPYDVPRESELLNGVKVESKIAGVRCYHHLPLFGEKEARYPGFTLMVLRREGVPSLIFRPHPMGKCAEWDFYYNLTAAERALDGRDAIMMRMGIEQVIENAIVVSHDLLDGRMPRPRQEPSFPVLRGVEAHLDLIDRLDVSRKFVKAELAIKNKNQKWKSKRSK